MAGATRRAVLLFARTPANEARRSRLASTRRVFNIAQERIARAATALQGVDLVVVGASERPALAPRARMLRARGRAFSERLDLAFRDVRALGHSHIVAIPTDVPGIDQRVLEAAFTGLERRDFVLGPSSDGDVYLVGARLPVDRLFSQIRWRTEHAARDLAERARDPVILPELTDLDPMSLSARPSDESELCATAAGAGGGNMPSALDPDDWA